MKRLNFRWYWVMLAIGLVLGIATLVVPAYSQYQTKVYLDNNGDRLNIAAGGELKIAADATVTIHDATYLQANANMYVNAPTAIATATPALMVNSLGVSNLFEVRDASTPVAQFYNGGGAKIAAPTAIATAVPALVVDSLGVSNLFEVRDAATPVFAVNNGGAVVAGGALDVGGTLNYGANDLYAVGYASAGQAIVAGVTATFTGTTTVASGLTTVIAAVCVPYTAPAATAATCYATWSGATVTLRSVKADGVTAGDTGTTVNYMIFGTK